MKVGVGSVTIEFLRDFLDLPADAVITDVHITEDGGVGFTFTHNGATEQEIFEHRHEDPAAPRVNGT
jgi:hypothetical protein